MPNDPQFPHLRVLWIEEQIEEYYPIDEDLKDLFTVHVAETIEKGTRSLTNESYDLLILDLMLPANIEEYKLYNVHLEAGKRLLRQLRDSEESKGWATPSNCKTIVFTARGDEDALAEVEGLIGTDGKLIQKPVDPDEFIKRARAILLGEEE